MPRLEIREPLARAALYTNIVSQQLHRSSAKVMFRSRTLCPRRWRKKAARSAPDGGRCVPGPFRHRAACLRESASLDLDPDQAMGIEIAALPTASRQAGPRECR